MEDYCPHCRPLLESGSERKEKEREREMKERDLSHWHYLFIDPVSVRNDR